MEERCDALPLYGERTVCADSNSTVGVMGDACIVHFHSSMFPLQQTKGILAQLELKYMQGKGFFSLILWGRRVLNSLTFIFFPNDVLVGSESFLRRIRGMFRKYSVFLREGLRWSEINLIL